MITGGTVAETIKDIDVCESDWGDVLKANSMVEPPKKNLCPRKNVTPKWGHILTDSALK